ncbi:MAG: hypothetical protein V5A23_00480 [Halobacteriales archaeon]
MADENGGAGSAAAYIERALIEAHHLANLTGTEEARLARHRLVDAQSAAKETTTRDMLQEAVEYLELARLDRRDAAKGFERARSLAVRAETALSDDVGLRNRSIDRLFDRPRRSTGRRSLEDIRSESAVSSYEQLRSEMALERLLAELREDKDANVAVPSGDLSVEEALELADRELDAGTSPSRDGDFVYVEGEEESPVGE